MADFGTAWSKLLRVEGGYSNDPVDPGAETIFGISRRSHPHWDGWPHVDALKTFDSFPSNAERSEVVLEQARAYYKPSFWEPMRCDAIPDQGLAEVLFDGAVNMGIFGISTMFQRALNAMNRGGGAYPITRVDGSIGPNTTRTYYRYILHEIDRLVLNEVVFLQDDVLLERVKALPAEAVEKASTVLAGIIRGLRIARYIEITERDNSLRKFLRGWLRRCF